MISVTIITLNEQANIEKAIKSVLDLADEIIVVDSGSKDKTVELAEKLGAKVYLRKFDNFSNQKNFAASKTEAEWILSVDADEELSPDLIDEIKKSINSKEFDAYLIPRRNFILGQEIKHSRWSPDTHIWLWKKDFGKWVGDVHEEVIVTGKVGSLKNSKIHNSHQTLSSFLQANNLYSDLESLSLYKKHCRFSLSQMFWESLFEFFIRFIYKFGFLDGKEGFALAYVMGIYKLIVWVKIWELGRKQ